MNGLESIALAVAHLESKEKGHRHPSPPAAVPFGGTNPRMVSMDVAVSSTVTGTDNTGSFRSSPVASVPTRATSYPGQPQGQHVSTAVYYVPVPSEAPTVTVAAAPTAVRRYEAKKPKKNMWGSSSTTTLENTESQGEQANRKKSPVATLLVHIAGISNNLDQFFHLMHQLEKIALENQRLPDIPKQDQQIHEIQKNDVLLGRGGETNHHMGNIQYRQLVKACQPAYLIAKRSDKPRIAVAIVQVIRCRGGRFLKKHQSGDNVWRDVGNQRAREKTSQALREGAPDLRNMVQVPSPPTKKNQPVAPSPPKQPPTIQRVTSVAQSVAGHPPQPMAMPLNGHAYYQLSQEVAAVARYSPTKGYYLPLQSPPVIHVPVASKPKRSAEKPAVGPKSKFAKTEWSVPVAILAEDSEEERLRTQSPFSSASSSSNNNARGPRIKLLKRRVAEA